MKTAIIADWLVTYGGAEHVLTQLHDLFPKAPFYTTVAKPASLGPLKDLDIHTSRLQTWYKLIKNHQLLLPFMPRAIEDINLSAYDLIISSSHAVAKGIIPPQDALHVCYCHTPMRYAWEMEEEYLNDFHVPHILRGPIKKQLEKLRQWDLTTAKRVDVFIANSQTTQERIKRIYNRESIVISPPVEDRFFNQSTNQPINDSTYFLALGRLVPYKRFDLLIEVANELKLPLHIAGTGQDEARLKKMAGPTVTFLGYVDEDKLPSLYANAEALLFPQYEDAGIVALEAQAAGTPVIAFEAGGAIDVIDEGVTGMFFDAQTPASLIDVMDRFKKVTWNRQAISRHAEAFSEARFREQFTNVINTSYDAFKNGKFSRA